MDYKPEIQAVAAGDQFTGLAGAGRFQPQPIPQKGWSVACVMVAMGMEAKTVSIDIVKMDGTRYPIDTRVASLVKKLVLLGSIPLGLGDHIEIITSGAISAMRAEVLFVLSDTLMGMIKIIDGVTELGNTTIESPTIEVNLDAATDSVKIGAQTGGASGKKHFSGNTPADNAWTAALVFGFQSQAIRIENRGSLYLLEYSFDGVNVAGSMLPDCGNVFDHRHETSIYLRSVAPTAYYVEGY